MFSISPFLDYQRPKSYSLFDEDFYPFSSNRCYIGEQAPSPFGRTFSLRRPQSSQQYPATFQQPRPERPPKCPESDDDELSDPFLDLFGLRPQSKAAAKRKESKKACDQPSRVQQSRVRQSNGQHSKAQPLKPEAKPEAREQLEQRESAKKLRAVGQCEEKVLDSQRFDTDSEIVFRFGNYRCTSPSGVDVRITKENYIELRTADGYTWKNRLSDDVGDLQKASCTVLNGVLSLKLPKRAGVQADKQSESTTKQTEKQAMKEQKEVKEQKVEQEEFDPDAPIVEDIYEDEEMN